MSTKKHIDRQVEKTMQALDNLEPAKTDDFFYSRLIAKMEHHQQPAPKSGSFEFGFALAAASILIITSLNVLSISTYSANVLKEETTREALALEDFTADYQVFELNYYDTFEEE